MAPRKLYRSNLIKEKILSGIDTLTCVPISVPIASDRRSELCQFGVTVRFIFPFTGDTTAAVPAASKVAWLIWGMFTILLTMYDKLI